MATNTYLWLSIIIQKWVETKDVTNHGAKTITIEDDIICKFGVPKHVLMDNGRKWASEFDQLCKDYRIDHQYIAP